MITVFYDGKCGLCRREIDYYRGTALPGAFVWDDVTQPDSAFAAHGLSLVATLKEIHVLDDAGNMHIGVDAFIVIWRQLRFWKILAWLVALPGIYHMARFLYARFAELRFKRLAHCQIALEQHNPQQGRES